MPSFNFPWSDRTYSSPPPLIPVEAPKPDTKVYKEKLTHTYTCDTCLLKYRFDPNDTRKCSCPLQLADNIAGTYYSRKCKDRTPKYGCCHHYEEIVKEPCKKCGELLDRRNNQSHSLSCRGEICSMCDAHTYAWSGSGWAGVPLKTNVKLVEHNDNLLCVPCFKDITLVETMQKLTKALEAFNGAKNA